VDELRAAQDTENENHDAKVRELMDLRESDFNKYDAELGVWCAQDRKIHAGLQGLEDALLGASLLLPFFFRSFVLLPFLLAALAEAFPDSAEAVTAVVEECRAEYHIVRPKNPKAELSPVELMASIKGQLQPVATLESRQHGAVASVFPALWPGQAEPNTIDRLLLWITFMSNRVDVWKESVARAGAEQALSFVLSWYQGINLDQLEHLREDGLSDVDLVKLRRRACAIAECANTDKLFEVGESDDDEAMDVMEFEMPGFVEASEKAPEDIAGDTS
jgi:hypothetical protein